VFGHADFFSYPIMTPCHVHTKPPIAIFIIPLHDSLSYYYGIDNKNPILLKKP
jgi:hypothetical protein